MFWSRDLAFPITPKRGPLGAIGTLLDASRAMTSGLPAGYLKKPHWRAAGWAVMKAVDSGRGEDIKTATELLVGAFDAEGWLRRSAKDLALARLHSLLAGMEQPLRECMGPEARRAALKLVHGSKGRPAMPSTDHEHRPAATIRRAAG